MSRRRTHWRIGALVDATTAGLIAGAVVSGPASAAPAAMHGRVTDRGHAVAGVAVGYDDPDTGVTASTRTDAHGRFTVSPPSDAGTGFLWVGVRPKVKHVLFSAHGTKYVRAVVGAAKPSGTAKALFQTQTAAAPAAIGGGGTIAVHLRRSARLSGTARSLAGFHGSLRRGDGSVVASIAIDATGHYRTPALAPGRYSVFLRPAGAAQATKVGDAVLRSGRSATLPASSAARARHRLGALAGKIVSPKGVHARRVRVEAREGGVLVASTLSSTDGRYRLSGLPSGTYTVVAGRNAPDFDSESPAVSPTPADTVAVSRTVTVHAGSTAHRSLPLGVAGHISGASTVPGTVLVENAAGDLVRVARIGADERFTAGGLPTGTYTLVVRSTTAYGSAQVDVQAGRTTDAGTLAATTTPLTTRGTVPAVPTAAGEHLTVTADLVGGIPGYDTGAQAAGSGAEPDSTGAWTIDSLVPGRYRFVAGSYLGVGRTAESLPHADGPAVLEKIAGSASASVDLQLGQREALLSGSFRSKGGPGIGYLPYGITATDGTTTGIGGNIDSGIFDVSVVPGVYRWQRSDHVAPASDGPWYASPTAATVTVSPGIDRAARIPITIHG